MFEIYKRQSPMFAMSQTKLCANIFAKTLQFDSLNMSRPGIEILDIAQTVRINENNQFIVRSALSPEEVQLVLHECPTIKRLRHIQQNAAQLMEEVLKNMVVQFGIDSYVCIGKNPSINALGKVLHKATRDSRKPLMVFNVTKQLLLSLARPEWYGMDHPALWIGRHWLPAMDEAEAFFAMSPELKLEVGLNRYQPIESFGDFSVGLVRF